MVLYCIHTRSRLWLEEAQASRPQASDEVAGEELLLTVWMIPIRYRHRQTSFPLLAMARFPTS
ncbi:hypothetical protein BGW80DRAFT_293212 [Lactifluus volemus]|nr:hypothetical protein BGW80DRAFT_293212 [Lactifluus volemus]